MILFNKDMTPATLQKRREFQDFIQRVLQPVPSVQAVIGIGSIATGTARRDSDIDAIVLFQPYDPYVVPAESIWLPSDGSFHSIFSREATVQETGLQLDFARWELNEWLSPSRQWQEGELAELSESWLAFDRKSEIVAFIQQKTTFDDHLRQQRLDEALIWLDQHLKWAGTPNEIWDHLGANVAHDRLHAAYDYLVQALFAYNQRWRPWRNREMSYLLRLPWLPNNFDKRVLTALNAPAHDFAGYVARFEMLTALFADLLKQLVANDDYAADDPVGEAFVRSNDEPGRAWNMSEWNEQHLRRHT